MEMRILAKLLVFIVFLGSVLFALFAFAILYYYYSAPFWDFERLLLAKDNQIEFKSLVLTGQGQEIRLEDSAS